MTNNEFELYISELITLCSFFKISIYNLNTYISMMRSSVKDNQLSSEVFWYSAQNSVIYAANISKMLWGSSQSENNDRIMFRKLLKINDASPIRKKQFRNQLEHIDESLQKFSKLEPNVIINKIILGNNPNTIVINDKPFRPENGKTLRAYNYETTDFIFMGHTFNLKNVSDEIIKLEKIAKSMEYK